MRLPAITAVPEPLVTGTTAGLLLREMPGTVGGSEGDDFFPAFMSSARLESHHQPMARAVP